MCIVTMASGNLVNILDPDPETIVLEDIVLGLVRTARWRGQSKFFYSVMEHSLSGCMYLCGCQEYEAALSFLFHDAHEAYMGDIPSPFKKEFPELTKAENNFQEVINKKFGVPTANELVHMVDVQLQYIEANDLGLKLGKKYPDDIDSMLVTYRLSEGSQRNNFHVFYTMLQELVNV